MSDETPWSDVQRMFAEGRPFEDVLPALQKHGISGEDVGVLLNDPSSKLLTWVRQGSGESPVRLSAVEPPPDARLPSRRAGKRGLLGWLSGVNVIDGLGLFTDSDVFELHGVQFSVLPEPVRPVVFGEVVASAGPELQLGPRLSHRANRSRAGPRSEPAT